MCEPQRMASSNLSRACLGVDLLHITNHVTTLYVFRISTHRLALEALDLHKSPVGYMYRGGGRGAGRAWLFGRKSTKKASRTLGLSQYAPKASQRTVSPRRVTHFSGLLGHTATGFP